ncbi:MAG: hypothetical protein QXU26_02710 [Thermofilaceae archaeon]
MSSYFVYQLSKEGRRLTITGFVREGRQRVSIRVGDAVIFLDVDEALLVARALIDSVIRGRDKGSDEFSEAVGNGGIRRVG